MRFRLFLQKNERLGRKVVEKIILQLCFEAPQDGFVGMLDRWITRRQAVPTLPEREDLPPLTTACAPYFGLIKILFGSLRTTRQMGILQKGIITL